MTVLVPTADFNGLIAGYGELPQGIRCRVLSIADAGRLEDLRQTVVTGQLPDRQCYRFEAESPDFVSSHLGIHGMGEKGIIVGLFSPSGELIGYGALSLPGPGEPSRGDALGLPAHERALVAFLASAMLKDGWRHLGLHDMLIRLRLSFAMALARRHAVASVWPGNYFSWGNLVAHGLQGRKLIDIGDGMVRLVLYRDLSAPAKCPDPTTLRLVPVEELVNEGSAFDADYWLWRKRTVGTQIFAELGRAKNNGTSVAA